MHIKTQNIIIRAFERKDAENLCRIAREKNIIRFMPDWAEERTLPHEYYGYIDWQQSQKDSTDIYKNKRYAIAECRADETNALPSNPAVQPKPPRLA
ncbi:hypothetical protein FACS1894191_7520 [Clostridia bacterium]|nr:hypothetical protein FACS1894191_7520 [Clostridia bacterium]